MKISRNLQVWLLASVGISAVLMMTAAMATAERSSRHASSIQAERAEMAQAQQPFSEWAVPDLVRRITIIEGQSLDARVRVLENDVNELKLMSRGVALTVLGQLIVTGMGVMRRGKSS